MKIISGGQTGADQGAWRAAKAAGIATGGWMPKGFATEDGPRPEFAELYGAKQWVMPKLKRYTMSQLYRARTEANVKWADVTLWFHWSQRDPESNGYWCTGGAAERDSKPFQVIQEISPWLLAHTLRVYYYNEGFSGEEYIVNCAGSRESKQPGIGEWVENLLGSALRILEEA